MTAIGVEHASLVIEVLVYTALVLAAVACVRGGLHEQRAAIAVAFCTKPKTYNLKPTTSNLKPKTQNLKPKTSNPKPET